MLVLRKTLLPGPPVAAGERSYRLGQRRLQETQCLLKERGKTPPEVCLEAGFEGLSYFSFAFMKAYRLVPAHP